MQNKTGLPTVDIGIACYSMQASEWWTGVLSNLLAENKETIDVNRIRKASSMMPDRNKNTAIYKKRDSLTDSNRVEVVEGFMEEGGADWLFFIDDDTVPPPGAISKLISLNRSFVSGMYFLPQPPFSPVAYFRRENGQYSAIREYADDSMFPVDAVGLGCALIHRSVFTKIMEEHQVFRRGTGSTFAVHNSQVKNVKSFPENQKKPYIKNGWYHEPVLPVSPNEMDLPFPMFALEYGRTEDMYFCELCANVGIRPYLDTSIICEHWKMKPATLADYKRELDAEKRAMK